MVYQKIRHVHRKLNNNIQQYDIFYTSFNQHSMVTNLKSSCLEMRVGKYSEIRFQILYKTLEDNNTVWKDNTIWIQQKKVLWKNSILFYIWIVWHNKLQYRDLQERKHEFIVEHSFMRFHSGTQGWPTINRKYVATRHGCTQQVPITTIIIK